MLTLRKAAQQARDDAASLARLELHRHRLVTTPRMKVRDGGNPDFLLIRESVTGLPTSS